MFINRFGTIYKQTRRKQ